MTIADTRILNGWTQAADIRDSLNTAYWSESENMRAYHLNAAHESFRTLAEKLGYRVEKVATVEQHREVEAVNA